MLEHMDLREKFEALSPEQREEIYALLAPELARGWIPKESELNAIINELLSRPQQVQPHRSASVPR